MKRFDVIYSLQSDVRIGYRKIGNLHTTRYYIPGKAVWACCVNQLVNRFGKTGYPNNQNPYQFWENFLKQQMKFSYLFLMDTTAENNGRKLIPDQDGIKIIERRFISSTVGTALTASHQTAEHGSLHESEWIMAKSKDGTYQVLVSGFILIDDNDDNDDNNHPDVVISMDNEQVCLAYLGKTVSFFNDIILNLTVGGDITSGKGRIKLQQVEEQTGQTKDHGSLATGHVIWSAHADVEGPIEAVAQRKWDPENNHPGGISDYYLAWMPGSLIRTDKIHMDYCGRLTLY